MATLPNRFRVNAAKTESQWASRQGKQRGWYALPEWRRLRKMVLERDMWLCQVCRKPIGKGANVDHVIPHRGDWDLFIDPDNLQSLCHSCHSEKTVREDGGFGNG